MPRRGEFFTADGGRAELDPRRARIRKGMYLVSEAPAHRGEFVRIPDHLGAQEIGGIIEITRRLQAIRIALEANTKARKK